MSEEHLQRHRASHHEHQARVLQIAVNALEETLTDERNTHARELAERDAEISTLRAMNNRQAVTIRNLQLSGCDVNDCFD